MIFSLFVNLLIWSNFVKKLFLTPCFSHRKKCHTLHESYFFFLSKFSIWCSGCVEQLYIQKNMCHPPLKVSNIPKFCVRLPQFERQMRLNIFSADGATLFSLTYHPSCLAFVCTAKKHAFCGSSILKQGFWNSTELIYIKGFWKHKLGFINDQIREF